MREKSGYCEKSSVSSQVWNNHHSYEFSLHSSRRAFIYVCARSNKQRVLCGTQGKIDVVVGHSHQHTSVCSSSYGCLPTHPRGSEERPTGNEFARENKLHQVSNASINTIFQCPISAQAVPVFWPRRRQFQCSDFKCFRAEGLEDVEVSS